MVEYELREIDKTVTTAANTINNNLVAMEEVLKADASNSSEQRGEIMSVMEAHHLETMEILKDIANSLRKIAGR